MLGTERCWHGLRNWVRRLGALQRGRMYATITPPSLSYFLFPCCVSMLSLNLVKLLTCGVIRSYHKPKPMYLTKKWRLKLVSPCIIIWRCYFFYLHLKHLDIHNKICVKPTGVDQPFQRRYDYFAIMRIFLPPIPVKNYSHTHKHELLEIHHW